MIGCDTKSLSALWGPRQRFRRVHRRRSLARCEACPGYLFPSEHVGGEPRPAVGHDGCQQPEETQEGTERRVDEGRPPVSGKAAEAYTPHFVKAHVPDLPQVPHVLVALVRVTRARPLFPLANRAGDHYEPARHTFEFLKQPEPLVPRHMLEHLGADDDMEAVVSKGQATGISKDKVAVGPTTLCVLQDRREDVQAYETVFEAACDCSSRAASAAANVKDTHVAAVLCLPPRGKVPQEQPQGEEDEFDANCLAG